MDFCAKNPMNMTAFGITSDSYGLSDIISCYLALFQIIAIFGGAIGLLFYKLIQHLTQNRKCYGTLDLKKLNELFKKTVNSSLAVYVSDRPAVQMIFFIFGNLGFLFGFAVYLLLDKVFYNLRILQNGNFIELLFLGLVLLYFCNVTFIQLFLIVMIGAKIEVLEYTKNPIRSITMTTDERKIFVRSNLKRMLIITTIMFLIPQIIKAITNAELGVYLFMNFLIFYYSFERIAFLRFEKEILKVQSRSSKSALKINCIVKFLQEHGPLSIIHGYTSKTGGQDIQKVRSKIREIASFNMSVLDERLDLIQNDQSVPMPVNTGEISILSKLIVLLYFVMVIPSLAIILSNIGFLEWFSNKLYIISSLVYVCGMLFVNPFITIPLFSSKMMFDSKSDQTGESISQADESEDGRTKSVSSGYTL